MDPVGLIQGQMAPLPRANVDTDQIIPKQFLKRVERTGFGPFLFYDWAYDTEGELIPDFVTNRPEYANAKVLVTGPNFGSGSSREHAPWALEDWGFEAIIAPSFADIFRNNCHKIGLLPVELTDAEVADAHRHGRGPRQRGRRSTSRPDGGRRRLQERRSRSTTSPNTACSTASTTSPSPSPMATAIDAYERRPRHVQADGDLQ